MYKQELTKKGSRLFTELCSENIELIWTPKDT